MVVHEDKFVITGSDDGGVRMWSVEGREQTLQFLVMNQVCMVIVILSSNVCRGFCLLWLIYILVSHLQLYLKQQKKYFLI